MIPEGSPTMILYFAASSILSDMLEVIESGNTFVRLQKKHLHILMLPHLDKLKLPASLGENSFAFELVFKRCKVRKIQK